MKFLECLVSVTYPGRTIAAKLLYAGYTANIREYSQCDNAYTIFYMQTVMQKFIDWSSRIHAMRTLLPILLCAELFWLSFAQCGYSHKHRTVDWRKCLAGYTLYDVNNSNYWICEMQQCCSYTCRSISAADVEKFLNIVFYFNILYDFFFVNILFHILCEAVNILAKLQSF